MDRAISRLRRRRHVRKRRLHSENEGPKQRARNQVSPHTKNFLTVEKNLPVMRVRRDETIDPRAPLSSRASCV